LSEYARLLAALTREEDVKSALIESGLSRTREQQDCRVPRDAFWTTLVEKRFNDNNFKPDVDLRGVVDGVDAKRLPSQKWLGAQLKKQYLDISSNFTAAYRNWSKSGQICTANFGEYCQRGRREGLTLTGKKTLVMFTMFRCGTDEELTNVVEFTLRTFPNHMALDTYDVANGDDDRDGASEWARRKAKKRNSEAFQCFSMLSSGLDWVANAMVRSEAPAPVSATAKLAADMDSELKLVSVLAQFATMESQTEDADVAKICREKKMKLMASMQ